MLRIAACITQQHDFRLVMLAGLICCLACFTTINMLSRASSHENLARTIWGAGAAFVFGCGVWTTHFVAMLAFNAHLIIGYEVTATALSLATVWIGSLIAFRLSIGDGGAAGSIAGGFVLGAGIGAMHYIGVNAMRLHGTMSFDGDYVMMSIIAGMGFSTLALYRGGMLDRLSGRVLGAVWMLAAVVGLHFTGMAAISIHPSIAEPAGDLIIGSAVLATIVIAVSSIILALSLFGSLMDQHLSWRVAQEASSLHRLAHFDPLTGLPNRMQCRERLDRMLEKSGEAGGGVFCLDLDRFKQVNDLLGHHAGDQILIQVAERLQSLVRPTDLVARVSGDEFVVALPPPVTAEAADALAERLVEALTQPFAVEDQLVTIGTSVGIALYPADGTTAADLLRNADMALYEAKKDGRGLHRFFESAMNERLHERQMLEQDLRHSLSDGQLEVHYQPLFEVRSRTVIGFEALVRWHHPTRGQISPADFIPLAEETGLILTLGRWVLETACKEAASWDFPLRIAVNLSPVQFRQTDLAGMIATILAESGLAAERLELEVTESVLIHHADQALEALNKLKEQGIRLSLDDFGTGYSSLSYLRRFPFHKLKIDRSFVQSLGQDNEAAVITRAIVALGRSLHLQVTAEGVETQAQYAFLEAEACDQMQGYLIGRPVPAREIAALTRHLAHDAVAANL